MAAGAKNYGVIGFATNAFISPAVFLAIEAAETKQAEGSPREILKMNSPGASQDEIDPAVIRRVAEGDSVAFERVYDAFSGILYSLALRILERPEDTEELLQEVFLKIWRDAEDYDPRRGAPLAWAITITRHKAIDKIRSTTRRLRLYEAAEAEAKNDAAAALPQPLNDAESSENAQAVRESLGRLDPEVRESIELAFFGGLSHSQIAAKLSLPLTTVKSRIRRAMMQLRQSLRHYQ
jgi:RNA polymerase sigma-70 factor, ECF subfamily